MLQECRKHLEKHWNESHTLENIVNWLVNNSNIKSKLHYQRTVKPTLKYYNWVMNSIPKTLIIEQVEN